MSTELLSIATEKARIDRWLQLFFGLICMMAISSPQYVWTQFTSSLTSHLGATLAQVQVTFSILISFRRFFPFAGLPSRFRRTQGPAIARCNTIGTIVFQAMIVMDFVAAIMAVAVLKPLRQRLGNASTEDLIRAAHAR
jgi:hypothetical protein